MAAPRPTVGGGGRAVSALAAIAIATAATTAGAQAPALESPWAEAVPALPFPAVGAAPQGIVLDEALAPIAGASVELLWETAPSHPFARATAQRLAATPLPATRTGRDGTFVLPLTDDQLGLGDVGWQASGCWLLVTAPGYRPWREPVRGGPRSYLGSRVLLRRERDGDAFADVPWPPAVVSIASETSMLPWVAVAAEWPELGRRGAESPPPGNTPAAGAALATLAVRIRAGDEPVAFAPVAFDDAAYERPADLPALPLRADADGQLEVRLPAGGHRLRVTVAGHGIATMAVELRANERTLVTVPLARCEPVDVLAVTQAGVPVPFTRLAVIPKHFDSGVRSSFFVFSDSAGRARLWLDEPGEWFVYGDFGATAERFELARDCAGADGVFRVTKKRPVTIRMTGDRWPRTGDLHWHTPERQVVMRGFVFDPRAAEAVVFRLCYREDERTIVGGDGGPPFVIVPGDLPPMPAEPLLDLAALDRTLRPRATVVPRSAAGGAVLRFAVVPTWQADGDVRPADAVRFARRSGDTWTILARSDDALDVVATAAKHAPKPFVVPARVPGEPLPELSVELALRQ